jgi:hypothetical protein
MKVILLVLDWLVLPDLINLPDTVYSARASCVAAAPRRSW